MSLHLHRAERADVLVDALGEVLAAPLDDPFATEVVCVPTPGVERWIAQRLAHRLGSSSGDDGVCAGVDFPSPARFVADALGRSGGDDPWAPSRAVWPLLAVLETAVAEPWAAVLADHLGPALDAAAGDAAAGEAAGGDTRRSRRWSTARRLAGLFARYAADRPSMLEAWAAGRDLGPDLEPLPDDRAWQPELWRRLRDHVGGPDPVARLREDLEGLRAGQVAGGAPLPERLSVFGATALDPRHLDVLLALAASRDVHLWLPHPSPTAWDRVAREAVPAGPLLPLRADVAAGEVATNPLLTYLGRDLRELQVRLGSGAARAGVTTTDEHHPAPARPGPDRTLLGRLQADLAADRPPAGDHLLDPGDRSVQVHACAGPHRQVEVLREVLLGLLADDETLQPRDVVVMCPDVEAYAPLVAATFGLDAEEDGAGRAEHPGHRLRVRLADRSLRQLNPVLATVGRLLDLADARVTLSALLDLAAAEPVATRFRLGEDDLERLHELLPRTGVRWGLDAAHRARFGMAGFAQNTWAAGLDRLLLGVAMDESDARFIGTVLPLDDVASDDVGLVGRLAELLGRVRGLSDACATPKTLPDWLSLCREVVEQLTDVRPPDRWQHTHAYGELARLEERAGAAALQSTLSLTEVRTLLADAFRGRAGRANFRTGTLTVASLLPMRAVPHRVVCLLGMDDGAFPRRATPDGDDLTAAVRRVGDPDPRGEDRQLFLDAVCSARETLVVLHSATDPRNGSDLRPAVPVEALLETLDATARTVDGRPVREHLTVSHALQPFGPANFTVRAGAAAPEPFSFDRAALRGARAGRGPKAPAPTPYAGVHLDPLPGDRAVELGELYRFFQHPVRALLRARAGLVDGGREEGEDEQIPVELDGLQRWAIGERMLQAHLRGADLDVLAAAEWRRGSVPPRELGARVVGDLRVEVGAVAAAAASWTSSPAERVDLVVDLDRVRVTGSVDGVRAGAAVRVLFSRPSARHRLQSWVELLALTAGRPEQEWRTVVVGRKEQFELGPVTPEFARLVLADLVDLQSTGLRTLVPFAPLAAYEYARQGLRDPQRDDAKRLEEAWGRDRDVLWERVLGTGADLDALMAEPALPGEGRPHQAGESRFGSLARRVFVPLLRVQGR